MQLLPIYNTRIGYVHKNSHKYILFFEECKLFTSLFSDKITNFTAASIYALRVWYLKN